MFPFIARTQAACLSIILALCQFAHAADTPNAAMLTLAQAIERAKLRNPALAASVYELQVAEARKSQAQVRFNPELALDLEDFAGTGVTRGTESLQATLSLSQVIELGGKRGFRIDAAQLQGDLAAIELQAKELDLLAEVTKRFIDVVAAQEQLELMNSSATLAEATVNALTTRVQAARSPQAELSRAQISATRAKIDARQAYARVQTSRRSLASLWSALVPDFQSARADLYALTSIIPLEELRARIQQAPDITRFATEARLREAQWQLAQAQSKPNLTLSLGVRRLEATNDNALVAGISMPLRVFDRGSGSIAEARVRREQSTAEAEAARVRVQSTAAELYEQISLARERVTLLRNEAIPQAQTALEQTQYGYERGRFSYLELAAAQQELIVLRSAAIEAAADFHRLSAEIERITGAALASRTQ